MNTSRSLVAKVCRYPLHCCGVQVLVPGFSLPREGKSRSILTRGITSWTWIASSCWYPTAITSQASQLGGGPEMVFRIASKFPHSFKVFHTDRHCQRVKLFPLIPLRDHQEFHLQALKRQLATPEGVHLALPERKQVSTGRLLRPFLSHSKGFWVYHSRCLTSLHIMCEEQRLLRGTCRTAHTSSLDTNW